MFKLDDNFIILLIDRDTVTKVTTLNRIMSHRCLIFMGNGSGVVSYGRGKGINPELTLANAMRNAKQNLIALPIDQHISVPQKLH
jgi:ribosomal protein S5